MLRQRRIRAEDYDMLASWWAAQKFPVIPWEALPQIGVLIGDENEPLAAGWLYQTDSCIAWIEWVVANPKPQDRKLRSLAIDAVISALTTQAKEIGAKMIFTSNKHARLGKRFKDQGFQHTDSGVNHFLREV